MPRVKAWTINDRERALQWIAHRSRLGADLADQSALESITNPDALAAELRARLSSADWTRLLSALRQRKHASKVEPASAAGKDCRTCAELRAMLEQYKMLDSDQKRELAALDLQLERHKRSAKSEADRLKRELAEAHKIIESQKREIVRITKPATAGDAKKAIREITASARGEARTILLERRRAEKEKRAKDEGMETASPHSDAKPLTEVEHNAIEAIERLAEFARTNAAPSQGEEDTPA